MDAVNAYAAFLEHKRLIDPATGIAEPAPIGERLFPFQRDITRWALRRGRAAIFADCGLGKTAMQLEWARQVPGRVLILTPLAVAEQTVREGEKFGVECTYLRRPRSEPRITVTNYELLEHFNPPDYAGIVLDESSILKSYDGVFRNRIIESFNQTPFRLACTATPAPNDYMELGNHAEFLGTMTRAEMLAMFFIHDGGETQKWRLKGHANQDWWRWLASWAVVVRQPANLGYPDDGFLLPALRVVEHRVTMAASDGALFALEAQSLQERIAARRESVDDRVAQCAEQVNGTPGSWIVWCHLNTESEALTWAIPGAVEIRGSDPQEDKAQRMLDFAAGKIRVLVTKPTIAGFGMNWQHCHQVAFVGLSDSYEQYYQAVRRCWRFGQAHPVTVHLVVAETEGAVLKNINRKEADAQRMAENMVSHMHELNEANLRGTVRSTATYAPQCERGQGWTLHLGDCCEVLKELPSDSIHYTIFSPPFSSLYTYSNSERDLGNSSGDAEFFQHFAFTVKDLYRVTMPGRLLSFHCMNLPTSKARDGVIGIRDFRGDLIRLFEAEGWIYHSEVCIWKDPVTAMQRTKALGLLYKQLRKDSAMSRQGIPDYLVTLRKPGENPEPVTKTHDGFPVGLWQRYASPVWMDINPSDTLQFRNAREEEDERHIAPLQLEVIRRAVVLWSNPGDTILSPFAGIGSEGHVAITEGRQFIGVELKRSYWDVARKNLAAAHPSADLFSLHP